MCNLDSSNRPDPCTNTCTVRDRYGWQPRFRRNQTAQNNADMAAGWRYGRSTALSEYYRNPSTSYTDMVMHYTKKMLDTFADGIYYDNVFFTTMYRPAPAGPGYVRDDGTLGAGVDVWGWRNFMRRSAVLQHAMGREHTVLWPHMSTFNVLPIIGWATINYDWEERMAGDGAPEMDCSKCLLLLALGCMHPTRSSLTRLKSAVAAQASTGWTSAFHTGTMVIQS